MRLSFSSSAFLHLNDNVLCFVTFSLKRFYASSDFSLYLVFHSSIFNFLLFHTFLIMTKRGRMISILIRGRGSSKFLQSSKLSSNLLKFFNLVTLIQLNSD